MKKPDSTSPVIVFDSGFGGISVLKKLVAEMPNENFLYFGDSKNAPYGPRTKEEISKLAVSAISPLMDRHPKGVVIACNTATAAAIDDVRALCKDIPVIGILPAVGEAAAFSERVLVLATQSTIDSDSFAAQLASEKGNADIIALAAPGLVTYVEDFRKDREGALRYTKELLQPVFIHPVDAVVLGCTHFPFAKDVIAEALGYDVMFFDAADHIATKLDHALTTRSLRRTQDAQGDVTLLSSADDPALLDFARFLLEN